MPVPTMLATTMHVAVRRVIDLTPSEVPVFKAPRFLQERGPGVKARVLIAPCSNGERRLRSLPLPSRDDAANYFSRNIRQPEFAAIVKVGQLRVIQTKKGEDRGMHVVDGNGIDGGAIADFIGF